MQECKLNTTNSGEFCDLHAHTHFSDGSLSPTELVDLAVSSGLSAIAITDHNTIGGVPEFCRAAVGKIKAIPGIEFSTDYFGTELHVLALGFSEAKYFGMLFRKQTGTSPLLYREAHKSKEEL